MAIKLVISGCCGRMGQVVARCALQDSRFTIAAALEADGHEAIGRDYGTVVGQSRPLGVKVVADAKAALRDADVVIEFTLPEATVAHVRVAQTLRKPMVIGTTGLSAAQQAILTAASEAIPILISPNMSLGVNVLFELAQLAAERLGTNYDVEVVESHHRYKKDAPSGTAKRLVEVLESVRRAPKGSLPVHAIRAGDIVGDHTVVFAGASERLELTHRAQSREVFAQGALRAAQFVVTQPPGLYDMSHVLKASS